MQKITPELIECMFLIYFVGMGRQATVNLAPWERNYFGERLSFLRMLR